MLPTFCSEEYYDELAYDTDRHFWTDDNSLVVEAAGSNFGPAGVWKEDDEEEDKRPDKQQVSKYAVEKLLR